MKFILVSLLCVAGFLTSGCADQSEQKFKNKAKAEGEADAEANTSAQEKQSAKMEADLARIQRFYQGVRGLYQGTVRTPTGRKFKVQFNIHPTIEVYEGTRIRTVDEISGDLTRLALDIAEQTSSVLSDGSDFTLVCAYVDIKPGVDRGFFNLEAHGCPRFFQVNLVPEGSAVTASASSLDSLSRSVAERLLTQSQTRVEQLQVEMRTSNLPDPMLFTMKRVK